MIDKKISLGTVITICTIIGTFIYTQGAFSHQIKSFEDDTESHSKSINKNVDKIQDLEISVGKIETKLDEGFKRLEQLIMEM